MADDDRNRLRLVEITHEAVMIAMLGYPYSDDFTIRRVTNLPEGWKIYGIYYRPEKGSFDVVIQHPSFEPVGEGAMIPKMIYECKSQRVTVIDGQDVPSSTEVA